MKKILTISNYQEHIGGISLQVETSNFLLNKEKGFSSEIFSVKASPLKRILLLFKLILKSGKYDILHIHACSYWGFLPVVFGFIAGRLSCKKMVLTYHGGDADNYLSKNKLLTGFFLKRIHRIIVLSDFLKEIFEKHGFRVDVIPNILQNKEDIYIEPQKIEPKFITTRSLEPLYNIELLIRAFYEIKKEYPEAVLTVIGDGSQRTELEELCKSLNLKDVHFTGQVRNDLIPGYLIKSSVILNTPHTDNMPVSLLEAFSTGVLVISSNVGGVPYMIKNMVNGLLFEDDNLDELVSTIKYSLNNQQKSISMIKEARKSLERYKWPFIKKDLLNLYNQL